MHQPTPMLSPAAQREPLVRVMGTLALAAAIVNITIGGGIFRLPSSVAGALGAAAPVAYLVCAVAMGLIVVCIADAGTRVALTGGPYAYVGTAFGPYAGFISGVLLWMLGTFAAAAVSTVFASSVGLLVPALSGPVMQTATLVLVLTFWSAVNVRGVALGSRLNSAATVAKLLPLLLVALAGLFFIRGENLAWAAPPAAADVARTSLLLIFAFAGIEVALVPSGEVRDTARTVPRATAIAMVAITILYVLLQVAAQGILGDGLARATTAPLADAAGAAMGGWARTVLLAGAAISMFGYLGGMTLSMPRMLYAFARDGFLPRRLHATHAEFRSPHVAIVVQSALTVVLAASGTFEQLALLANISALALYFGCAAAAWRLHSTDDRRARDRPQAVSATSEISVASARPPSMVVRAAPWLAGAVIAWLLTGVTRSEWLAFGVCVAGASLLYAAARAFGSGAIELAADNADRTGRDRVARIAADHTDHTSRGSRG